MSPAYSPVEPPTPTARMYSILTTLEAIPSHFSLHPTNFACLLLPQVVFTGRPEGLWRAFGPGQSVYSRTRDQTRRLLIYLATVVDDSAAGALAACCPAARAPHPCAQQPHLCSR